MDVAVKTMRVQKTTTKADRLEFLKEARIMRSYQHKHLVELYGVAVQEDPLMIVMELCSGGSLLSLVKSKVSSNFFLHFYILITTKWNVVMLLILNTQSWTFKKNILVSKMPSKYQYKEQW